MRIALLLCALCGALTLSAEPQSLVCTEPADFAPSRGLTKQEDGSILITTTDGFRSVPAKRIKIDPSKNYLLKYEVKLADGSAVVPSIVVAALGYTKTGLPLAGAHAAALLGTETEVLADAPKGATTLKVKSTATWSGIPKMYLRSFGLAIDAKEDGSDLPNRRISPHVKSYTLSSEPVEIEFKWQLAFPVAAGTKVRVHLDQASFGIATTYTKPTSEWKSLTVKILPRQECAPGKVVAPDCWWPGVETAGIFLSVRGKQLPAGSGVLIRNISLTEVE